MLKKFTTALVLTASLPSLAWAQETSENARAGSNGASELADIIVTAQKRSTSLQKTPVAVTAISAEALQDQQVRSLPDITAMVPNFQMGSSNGYSQITIRGIGISNFLPTAESAVAVNQNEVYVSRPIAHMGGMHDISSIEVLRGPQGTLYGRNATAGAVNVTTTRPTDVFSGFGLLTVGNYGLVRFEGAVGGPVAGDKVLLRVAGFRERRNGYGKNLFTGNDIDDMDAYAVRATLVVKPTEDLTATVIADYFKENDRGAGIHYFGASGLTGIPGALGMPPIFILFGGSPPPTNPRNIDTVVDPKLRVRTTALTGILEWSRGPVAVKSITGYRDQNTFTTTDLSGGHFPDGVGGESSVGFFLAGEPAEQFSQELQFNYDSNNLNLTAGLYYFNEDIDYVPSTVGYSNILMNVFFGTSLPVPGYTRLAEIGGRLKTKSWAAFSQATINVTEQLSLTAGVRYSNERKHLFQRALLSFSEPFTGNNPPVPAVSIPPKTFEAVTPKFGIEYQVTPDTMIYASFARGFKSGGFDTASPPAVVGVGFRPEKLNSYEAGIRTALFDKKARFNLTGFYYEYSDLQVQQVIGSTEIATSNAGVAHVYGIEAEMQANVTSELSVDMNAAWLRARYAEFVGFDSALPNAGLIDFSGNRLNNSPTFRSYLGATYKIDMPNGDVSLRASGEYTTRYYFTPANIQLLSQGEFVRANASITYEADAGWHVTAYMKNITDKTVRVSADTNGPLFGNPAQGALAPPRTFGVEIGYKF